MEIKRLFDIFLGLIILIIISPLIIIFCLIIYLYDGYNPIYISSRVGKKGKLFKIYKLRSMVINADKIGGTSTSKSDKRLLPFGKLIRKLKLDELTQIINVINGTMSFVGPRPNTPFDVNLYSSQEQRLLSVRPGITDFSSIVFADEGEILDKFENPDLAYNQLIRPWKSRLGLFYLEKSNLLLDILLILLTLLNSINRRKTLEILSKIVMINKGSISLISIVSRKNDLVPTPPPGFSEPINRI